MIRELCVKCWNSLDSHALNGCCDAGGTVTHCGRLVEWELHEHGDALEDPCYAWVCVKCATSSQYDCEELPVNATH